jgi:hypothetical protein
LPWIQLFAESGTARGIAIDRDDCRRAGAKRQASRYFFVDSFKGAAASRLFGTGWLDWAYQGRLES